MALRRRPPKANTERASLTKPVNKVGAAALTRLVQPDTPQKTFGGDNTQKSVAAHIDVRSAGARLTGLPSGAASPCQPGSAPEGFYSMTPRGRRSLDQSQRDSQIVLAQVDKGGKVGPGGELSLVLLYV